MTTLTATKVTPDDLLRLPDSQSMELVNGDILCEGALPGFVCKVSELFPPVV